MQKKNYFIKVHGHSCLEFRSNETAIIFDPWLSGSAYWRSWWNFPEPTPINEIIKGISKCNEIFVFITHLHWDHFHGPTLRKLYKEIPNLKFLISRVPEKRLKNDLFEVLNKNIQVFEINHGKKLEINPDLSLKVFLSGPFLTDSAILIQYKNDFILNLNDSKQQKLMAKKIVNSIGDGTLKAMFRSHSSANSRICIKNRDGSKKENNDTIDVWGDGQQTRTFLYVDECVEATYRLMQSDFTGPVNIGSEEMISMNDFAHMVIGISGKRLSIYNIDGAEFEAKYGHRCPVGVNGRNSDNTLYREKIGWAVSEPLVDGMRKTYAWINERVKEEL